MQLLYFILKKFFLTIVFFITSLIFLSVIIVALFKFVNPVVTPYMAVKYFSVKQINQDWHSFDDINKNFFRAVIASEDSRFFVHKGIDATAIKEAMEYNKKSKNKRRGASTITMQTAKNTFLLHGRNFIRKAAEAYFTKLIEAVWGKKRILEVYANIIEVAPGYYGVGAASNKFFNKMPYQLSRREAALITAVLPNPARWNPAQPTAYISRRAYTIQARMNHIDLEKNIGK